MWFRHFTGEAALKGFYKYDNRRKPTVDPEINKYIEKSRKMAGVTLNPEVSFGDCFFHHRAFTLP